MKPLAFAFALGGCSVAAYAATSLPFLQDAPVRPPTSGSSSMMPIPTINPVSVDTMADRRVIDQARQASDTLEYNQTRRMRMNISSDGVKPPVLAGIVDSTGRHIEPPTVTITDPCKINPSLAACRSPEKVCTEMGGTWSSGKCDVMGQATGVLKEGWYPKEGAASFSIRPSWTGVIDGKNVGIVCWRKSNHTGRDSGRCEAEIIDATPRDTQIVEGRSWSLGEGTYLGIHIGKQAGDDFNRAPQEWKMRWAKTFADQVPGSNVYDLFRKYPVVSWVSMVKDDGGYDDNGYYRPPSTVYNRFNGYAWDETTRSDVTIMAAGMRKYDLYYRESTSIFNTPSLRGSLLLKN